MAHPWHDISIGDEAPDELTVVIEDIGGGEVLNAAERLGPEQ